MCVSIDETITIHARIECALDRYVHMVLGIEMNSSSDWIVAMRVLLLMILFGTPMHVLSGYLVGLEVTRQTHFMKVALYTFLIRSLFMLNIFMWCAKYTTVKPIVAGESTRQPMAGLLG